MVVVHSVVAGRSFRVVALGDESSCSLYGFLAELKRSHPVEFKKAKKLLVRCAQNGPPVGNPQLCRHFRDINCFELKTPGGSTRIFCFYDEGRIIVCTHGFLKKGQKTPAKEKERAASSRREYLAAKVAGTLRTEPGKGDDHGLRLR